MSDIKSDLKDLVERCIKQGLKKEAGTISDAITRIDQLEKDLEKSNTQIKARNS